MEGCWDQSFHFSYFYLIFGSGDFEASKPTFHLAPLPLFLAAIGLNFKNSAQIYSSTVNQNSKIWVIDFYLHDEILLKFLNNLRNVRGISVRANQESPINKLLYFSRCRPFE